jgi:hypothetical protein
VYLGLSPQAGIARTVGAPGRRAAVPIPTPAQDPSPRFLRKSSLELEPAGHRPNLISAWVTTPGCVYPHTLRAESPRYGHRVRREFTPLYPSSIDTRARTSGRFATGECEQPDLGCARGNPVGNPVEECHRSSSEITAATRSARNWLPDGVKCTFLGCCSLLSSGSHCENKSWTRTPWLCIKDIAAAL